MRSLVNSIRCCPPAEDYMFNLISATSIEMHSSGVKTFISSLSWKVSFFRLHLRYLSCNNNMFSMKGTERVLKSQSIKE